MLQVPDTVVENDPRWQMFSKGGTVDAVWDGLCIKLIPRLNSEILDKSDSDIFDAPEL
ncbi:MAG: hypothetical protein HC820_09165 [Hydrococcus sp. RM1_1_31]|nr:hypothetical protein [Hydrococcus sp. RM1_1_31]